MKYMFIEQFRSQYRVERMCHALDVSRSGYYAWKNRGQSKRELENEILVKEIKTIHKQSRLNYGSPRITDALKDSGYQCSENKVARLMRENKIKAKIKRKFRRSSSTVFLSTYAQNILNRQFNVTAINKVWVTDLTYIWTKEGAIYLAVVLDLYSRRIVGWAANKQQSSLLAQKALQRAIDKRNPDKGLIVHSDRGSQFACYAYQEFLNKHGFISSMNRQGNCWDNAVVESFFHTLKMEHVHWCHYQSRSAAEVSLFDYIELYYNSYRKHSYLGYKNPAEYERMQKVS